MPRRNWSRPLPRALTIPTVMDLVTPADVRALLGASSPKATRARDTCGSTSKPSLAESRGRRLATRPSYGQRCRWC